MGVDVTLVARGSCVQYLVDQGAGWRVLFCSMVSLEVCGVVSYEKPISVWAYDVDVFLEA